MKCGKIHALEIFKTQQIRPEPYLTSPRQRNNIEDKEP